MSGHKWSVGNPYGPICEVCEVALGTEFANSPCPGSEDVEIKALKARVAELLRERLDMPGEIGRAYRDAENKRRAVVDLQAEVERLRAACESAMHDLRSHDGDDEGGYLDDTEQELRKALGLCPNCTDGMEQSGRARITCGTCGDSGKSKEGVV